MKKVIVLSFILWANISLAEDIKKVIGTVALDHGEDPVLLQSIAFIESSFNPKAVGKIGEIGLFQLRPEFHAISLNSSVKQQTLIAIKYLQKLKVQCGKKFLQCWNMGPTRAKQKNHKITRYEMKVQNAYKNILYSRSFSSIEDQNIAGEIFK